jgi:hypothetical protein
MQLAGIAPTLGIPTVLTPSVGAVTLVGDQPNVSSGGGGGATQVFNYANFSSHSGINTAASAAFGGSTPYPIVVNPATTHTAGAAWYTTQQSVASFTEDFTFSLGNGQGITWCVQNSNSTTNPPGYGTSASADANGLGYGAYYNVPQTSQYAILNSIAIAFDQTAQNLSSWFGSAQPSSVGLYMEGGPLVGQAGLSGAPSTLSEGLLPTEDLAPYGINFWTQDVMAVHVVYDGSFLTMVLKDTTTGNQVRKIWPVNISTFTGSNAWFGFTGGTPDSGTILTQNILSWDHYSGTKTFCAAPTISPLTGQYSATQTVSISAQVGASIYYTTNGQLPTTSSTLYSGPFSVTASELITAIAVQSGYEDSYPATSYIQITASAIPTINFPSGFAGTSLIATNGTAQITSGAIQLTDNSTGNHEVGSAWFVLPVAVSAFDTTFYLNFPGANSGSGNGMTFCIQNMTPASANVAGNQYSSATTLSASGGINALGWSQSGLGYQGFQSGCCVKFDLYGTGGNANLTGFYSGGLAQPGGSSGTSLSPVSLTAGHLLKVRLQYNGTTLTQTVTDTVNSNVFTTSYTVNIPSLVNGSTAYVGFTGGCGGATAIQQITSWTM